MCTIGIGRISAIDYQTGQADVAITDHEDMILPELPLFSFEYDMPKVGDTVAVIYEENNGRPARGFILGRYFSEGNLPVWPGEGRFHKPLPDGEWIRYDSKTKTLEISADKVIVGKLEAKEIKADSINAQKIDAGEILADSIINRGG